MKIELNYDPTTGNITDNSGCMIGTWQGLSTHEVKKEGKTGIEALAKLKSAGFTAEEIMAMSARGLV